MVVQMQERLYTADDLARMPEDSTRRELVKGKLIEKPLHMRAHGVTTASLIGTLGAYIVSRDLGQLFSSAGFVFAENPDTVYGIDIAFISKARAVPITDNYSHVMPDLAVEVISPDDTLYEIDERLVAYFAAGVRQVWLVYPKSRTI